MKNNPILPNTNKLNLLYQIGFIIILILPILSIPPIFFPADWAKTIIFRIALSVMAFFILYQVFYQKDKKSIENKIQWKSLPGIFPWSLLALLGIYILATIFSVDPFFSFWGSPLRAGGLLNFSFIILFFFLSIILLKETNWNKFWDFSFIVADLVSMFGILQYFNPFPQFIVSFDAGSAPSTMGNSTFFAVYLLLLSFLCLSFGIKEASKKKYFYFFSLALFIFTILITGSRAAYLGLLVGAVYFLFFYPKKMRALKLSTLAILILILIGITYVNLTPSFPNFIEKNSKISYFLHNRLSLKIVAEDLFKTRFSTWKIGVEAIKQKPILGWGPENFSVAFDKNFDPSLPNIGLIWWDKAHNFLIDLSSTAGIPFLMVFIFMLGFLFWGMQKLKNNSNENRIKISATAIQATLIAYIVANLFGFDDFITQLVFFTVASYSFYLWIVNEKKNQSILDKNDPQKTNFKKPRAIFVLLGLFLIWFIWQDNIKPLIINSAINWANYYTQKDAPAEGCDKAIVRVNPILNSHSFLDNFVLINYADVLRFCITNGNKSNQEIIDLVKESVTTMEKAIDIRPLYTRSWIYLGHFENILLETDPTNPDFKNKAEYYFQQALDLSPKRTETYYEHTITYLVTGEYSKMQNTAQECIGLDPEIGDCWWLLSLSQLYLHNFSKFDEFLATAQEKGFNDMAKAPLLQLVTAYTKLSQEKNAETKYYPQLVKIYEKLIIISPKNFQYHASLAFAYKEVGNYKGARKEAQQVLNYSPESKPNVNAFLKTLPY